MGWGGDHVVPGCHVTKANSTMANEMGRVFHPPTCLVMWENVTRTNVKWANVARAFGTLARKEEIVDSGGIHHLPVQNGAWTCGSGRIHHLPNVFEHGHLCRGGSTTSRHTMCHLKST